MTATLRAGRADRRRPSLPTLVARAVADDGVFSRGDLVLCAISGGPDSSALLHVLAHLRDRIGHRVAACGVDHGLRVEAARELEQAAALAARLDVPFEVATVHVAPGGNLQARARAARYEALRAVATRIGATAIATGHTANDRAETVISRLLRGAGPRGLAVLPPRDGTLTRPLIRAFRSDVEAYVARHAISCASDPSNLDPRFQRVVVRNEVIPLLQSLAPRIVSSLCDLADALGEVRGLPDPASSLNGAQRKALARATAQGRGGVRLLLRGGREVMASWSASAGADVPEVEPQPAERAAGGSSASRHGDLHVFSQPRAFPVEPRILMQEDVIATGSRRRRRS